MTYTSMADWIADFKGRPPNPPGQSLLEQLPNELLESILLFVQEPSIFRSEGFPSQWITFLYEKRNYILAEKKHLYPCLLISRRLHEVTLPLFYQSLSLTTYSSYCCFKKSVAKNLKLEEFVRKIQLLWVSRRWHTHTEKLVPNWTSLPNLRTLHMVINESDGIPTLIGALLAAPSLESVTLVMDGLQSMGASPSKLSQLITESNIQKLIIHSMIYARIIEPPPANELLSGLLPHLPQIQTLYISGSYRKDIMSFVHSAARIKHLYIDYHEKNWFTGLDLIRAVTQHPACKDSLISLATGHMGDCKQVEISEFLRALPPTLKYLDAGGITPPSIYIRALSGVVSRGLEVLQLPCFSFLTIAEIEEIVLGFYYDFPPRPPSLTPSEPWNQRHDTELKEVEVAAKVSSFFYRSSHMTKKKGAEGVRPTLKYLFIATEDSILNSVLLAENSGLEAISIRGNIEGKELPKVGWLDERTDIDFELDVCGRVIKRIGKSHVGIEPR